MPYVDLDRRFSKWREDNAQEEDFHLFERSFSGEAPWQELLKYQRVVVLAEAGSGKSKELEERAKRVRAQGEYAFHATVQNVAKEGLQSALDANSKTLLEAWLNSEAPGWFFIDSVDEAKLDHIRFVDALRKLGDGLGGGLSRARIILSGRYSDWEFRADLQRLETILPIAMHAERGSVEPNEILSNILQQRLRPTAQDTGSEKPLVVLMAPLDKNQIRSFAEGQGVQELGAFMEALGARNLWHFAKRPLDLGWLVDYWQKNRRFGRFADMLEASIRARLVEPNPERGLRDKTDVDGSFAALERVGATMVFGRSERIEIPDTEISLGVSKALKLCDVLPDWPTEHISKLLTRPVFDPASLGQMRLHNDNEGVVRGFLAAKWIKRRRGENAPISRIFSLLFGDADGTPIVLPSAQETAAWLSIWDIDVAKEVIHRDPSLLLTAGDPSSLSSEVRQAALRGVIGELAAGVKRHERLDPDTLRRFSVPDMMATIQEGWSQFGGNKEVRCLLLNMIELGCLSGGADLARAVVDNTYDDRTTVVFGIRALGATGKPADFSALAKRIQAEADSLDDFVIWEALDVLFPGYISIEGFLNIIRRQNQKGDTSGHFGWRGKALIRRLSSVDHLKKLLEGLLGIVEIRVDEVELDDAPPDEKRLQPLIQCAASALLRRTPRRKTVSLVVDAAIRMAGYRSSGRRFDDEDFQQMLLATPERRRVGLWRAVELLKDHPRLGKRQLTNLWQLDFVGWSAGLQPEDISWLLEDVRDADTPLQRRLALGALLLLWRDTGKSEALLTEIKEAADVSQETRDFIEGWLMPPEPSLEEIAHAREMKRLKKKNEAQERRRDRSWSEFIERLKSNPQQLRMPPPDLKPGHVDGRLFHIWELLYAATPERTGYAIDDFGPLASVLGPEATREATDAFIRFWRRHSPTLTSSRNPEARNQVAKSDCMGIVGISLEAHVNPNWVDDLTTEDATAAAQFATLELNGFPHWLSQLAQAWPDEVRDVFEFEMLDHLANAPSQHGFLDKVAYTEPTIAASVSPFLFKFIAEQQALPEEPLSKVFSVIGRALPNVDVPAWFVKMAIDRFANAKQPSVAAPYLGFVFRIDPKAGVAALSSKLDGYNFPDQKILAEHVLPAVFGDRWYRGGMHPRILPFEVLERLVRIAFRTIRHEDDAVHDDVYSPDTRDRAEGARGTLFNHLVETPGRETLEALRRLASEPDCPLSKKRLAELIHERAATDAEHDPWPAAEAFELEKEFDVAPQTPRDLQLVGLSRIQDINHDLHHHRFSQGQTVKSLPNEREVQKWLAHELNHRMGRAYSLEREPHVADEKEPDVRLQSRATEASLPLEVKVAESWTLAELEEALTVQLAGRYLRERDQGHGLLVLVYQNARPNGWKDETRSFLTFEIVVERLRARAYHLGAGGADAAQVKVAVIDVSDIEIATVGKEMTREHRK